MDGITILNSYTDISMHEGLLFLTVVFFISALIVLLIGIFLVEDILILITPFLFFIILGLGCAFCGFIFANFEQPKIIYEVIVDDNIKLSDFTEKYDILNVEGKIYTIREKEES